MPFYGDSNRYDGTPLATLQPPEEQQLQQSPVSRPDDFEIKPTENVEEHGAVRQTAEPSRKPADVYVVGNVEEVPTVASETERPVEVPDNIQETIEPTVVGETELPVEFAIDKRQKDEDCSNSTETTSFPDFNYDSQESVDDSTDEPSWFGWFGEKRHFERRHAVGAAGYYRKKRQTEEEEDQATVEKPLCYFSQLPFVTNSEHFQACTFVGCLKNANFEVGNCSRSSRAMGKMLEIYQKWLQCP